MCRRDPHEISSPKRRERESHAVADDQRRRQRELCARDVSEGAVRLSEGLGAGLFLRRCNRCLVATSLLIGDNGFVSQRNVSVSRASDRIPPVPGRSLSKNAAADMRERILDAADVLLGQYGYQKMTMEDLAKEVSIGKGTLYLHFKSKEELTLSRIDRVVERLLERLTRIVNSPASVASKIEDMLITRVIFRYDAVQHYTRSINDVLVAIRPAYLSRRQDYFTREARLFQRVLSDGVASGKLAPGDPKELAETLITATNALLPYNLTIKELGTRRKVCRDVERIAALMLKGLLRRGTRVHRFR
jgi:AcrR family transcriptional regulator